MSLDRARAHCVSVAMREKERAQARQVHVKFAVQAWRGKGLVATVNTSDVDDLLLAADLAASGFDADVIGLTADTYLSMKPVNPRTGDAWARGDLAREVQRYRGLERGVVREVVMVAVFNRADDSIAEVIPYVAAGDHVSWGSDAEMLPSDQLHFGGRVQEVMTEIMRFSYPEFEADPIERPFRDLKAAKEIRRTLGRRSEVTLYAAWGSDEYRLFQRSSHIRVAEPEATQ